jgi:hypothetical protein
VRLTHELDWTELEEVVEEIWARKLKNAASRPPHLRALTGAATPKATDRAGTAPGQMDPRFRPPEFPGKL